MSSKKKLTDPLKNETNKCSEYNAKKADKLLNRYLDQHLPAPQQKDLRLHLEACTHCRRRLHSLTMVNDGLLHLPEVEPVSNLNALIMSKINTAPQPHRMWLPSVLYSLVIMVFLALGLLLSDLPIDMNDGNEFVVQQVQAQQETQFEQLLNESRTLSLIHVQDTTMALLSDIDTQNGDGNGQ